jgi:hypothetical protein
MQMTRRYCSLSLSLSFLIRARLHPLLLRTSRKASECRPACQPGPNSGEPLRLPGQFRPALAPGSLLQNLHTLMRDNRARQCVVLRRLGKPRKGQFLLSFFQQLEFSITNSSNTRQEALNLLVLVSTLLHAIVYVFLHSLLNVLVQIATKAELQKKK